MRPSRSRSIVLWLLVLGACGRGRGGGDGAGASPVELDAYCDRWTEMVCEAAEACGCLDELGVGIDGCSIYVRAECAGEVEEPVRSGARSFRAVQAGQCLAGARAVVADCAIDDADRYPEACDEMMVGRREEGEPCESTSDCVPGLDCWDSVCIRLPREGESCSAGTCADHHFCGEDGSCHEYRGRGGACPEGGMACDSELYCDDRTQTCEPYLARGEGCAHASYACGDDLTCAADGTCQPYPREGEPCASYACDGDLYCDDGGICRAPKREGQPCSDSRECASYECADGFCLGDGDPEVPDDSGCGLL